MKDGRFETQAEIYQALLDGKKIRRNNFPRGHYVELVNGTQKGHLIPWRLDDVTNWFICEEPKSKKKFYRRKWISFGDGGMSIDCMWYESKEQFDKHYDDHWVLLKSEEWEEMEVED